MVPEPADVFNTLAAVVNQNVIDGDHTPLTVARLNILLQEIESSFVEGFDIPIRLGEKSIEARLIGGAGKFPVTAVCSVL